MDAQQKLEQVQNAAYVSVLHAIANSFSKDAVIMVEFLAPFARTVRAESKDKMYRINDEPWRPVTVGRDSYPISCLQMFESLMPKDFTGQTSVQYRWADDPFIRTVIFDIAILSALLVWKLPSRTAKVVRVPLLGHFQFTVDP